MKVAIKSICMLVIAGLTVADVVQAQDGSEAKNNQIKAAVSAAPGGMQENATVLGYNDDGELITLREGEGELICLADDPADNRFHVACYYKGLEPFMKRGRELRAEGKSRKEIMETRQSEIKSGKLNFPEKPMALYSLTGPADGFDYENGAVRKANPLRVVYVPFATTQSTGITAKPTGPGSPWLMNPGKPWAHIMIAGSPVGAEKNDTD